MMGIIVFIDQFTGIVGETANLVSRLSELVLDMLETAAANFLG